VTTALLPVPVSVSVLELAVVVVAAAAVVAAAGVGRVLCPPANSLLACAPACGVPAGRWR